MHALRPVFFFCIFLLQWLINECLWFDQWHYELEALLVEDLTKTFKQKHWLVFAE